MKNEVYGEMLLTVCMNVSANNERLGLAEANFKVSSMDDVELIVRNPVTNKVYDINVIDVSVDWKKYYRGDEVE